MVRIDGVVGDRGIPFGRPVSGRVAGTGADNQRGTLVGDDAAGILECPGGQRQIPVGGLGFDAAGADESHERIEHMFRTRWRDACIGEPPLQLARTLPIEAEFDRRGDQCAHQARAKRQLHVEQQVEASAAQGLPEST